MQMIVREARMGDLPALSVLAGKTYSETFGDGLTPQQLRFALESTRSMEYFESVIDSDTILVAIEGGEFVGYVQISDVGYRVEGVEITGRDQAIHSIYVDLGSQGRGVGRALMDAAFSHPRVRGAENVYIDVYEANVRALNWYGRYGFSVVGRVEVVIGGEHLGYDLVMRRAAN